MFTTHLCIVVKTTADVNLLIPTFGVVVPQECQVAAAFGGCPPAPPRQCPPRPLTTAANTAGTA
jgi:hypothetical protein